MIEYILKFKNIVSEKKANYQTDNVHISDRIEEIKQELEEIQEKISRLESDVLPFEKKYEGAKQIIKSELAKLNIQTDVRLFAELVQHVDKDWQLAIETFLGKKRFDIVVDGRYCEKVMEIVHEHQLRDIKVVITDKLPETDIIQGSAAAMLDIPNEYGRRYANYLLNGIHLCNGIQELHQYPKGGLMIDGTLAKSFTMTCMNLQRTQIFMGHDAIKQQLKKAKSDKVVLEQEENRLIEDSKILSQYIDDIDAVNWDETRYIFDIQKRIDEKKTEFMDTILEEENEEEYTDYRKYFKYDMRILSRQDGEEVLADLSKKQGSASNGEKQTPYFIILAASLLQCYPKNVSCARLAFIDEAFSALSRERIEQMVKFFEDNKFQVIYAAPPEKIDSIGSHINSTISLCMKGKYTWAVEGLVKLDEFKTE